MRLFKIQAPGRSRRQQEKCPHQIGNYIDDSEDEKWRHWPRIQTLNHQCPFRYANGALIDACQLNTQKTYRQLEPTSESGSTTTGQSPVGALLSRDAERGLPPIRCRRVLGPPPNSQQPPLTSTDHINKDMIETGAGRERKQQQLKRLQRKKGEREEGEKREREKRREREREREREKRERKTERKREERERERRERRGRERKRRERERRKTREREKRERERKKERLQRKSEKEREEGKTERKREGERRGKEEREEGGKIERKDGRKG
ncbi:hypothetical protein WMY93_020075 [Mugilogobius chulae]|uniref:Uncharacterized protein n=1 Tax=Mugilogobius chulae TaxID=88201 RepID=A0AAW0NS22_9GOBI